MSILNILTTSCTQHYLLILPLISIPYTPFPFTSYSHPHYTYLPYPHIHSSAPILTDPNTHTHPNSTTHILAHRNPASITLSLPQPHYPFLTPTPNPIHIPTPISTTLCHSPYSHRYSSRVSREE